MNAKDIYYHGIRDQIRRVLVKMGPDRVDAGLTAFEDGSKNWSNCFFARAYQDIDLAHGNAEGKLMAALELNSVIPIRTVYYTFDEASKWISRDALHQFINDVRDESRPNAVLNLLKTLDISPSIESTEVPSEAFCDASN
jgi:hypothetical protein